MPSIFKIRKIAIMFKITQNKVSIISNMNSIVASRTVIAKEGKMPTLKDAPLLKK